MFFFLLHSCTDMGNEYLKHKRNYKEEQSNSYKLMMIIKKNLKVSNRTKTKYIGRKNVMISEKTPGVINRILTIYSQKRNEEEQEGKE